MSIKYAKPSQEGLRQKENEMSKKEELEKLFNMMSKDDVEEIVLELIERQRIKYEDVFFLITEKDFFSN